MPRSFGRPGITVSPAALRYGPRFTGRFFLTFGRAYGTSSYNSGCSSKISGSFIRNAPKSSSVVGDTVCTSSTNRRFDSLRYNSYRFNVRTKTLKCLTRDSDNLCVARYSSVNGKKPIFFSSTEVAVFGRKVRRINFSSHSRVTVDLSSAASTEVSITSTNSFNFVHFANSASRSSPGIFGILISFFFPQRFRSTQIPDGTRTRDSRET